MWFSCVHCCRYSMCLNAILRPPRMAKFHRSWSSPTLLFQPRALAPMGCLLTVGEATSLSLQPDLFDLQWSCTYNPSDFVGSSRDVAAPCRNDIWPPRSDSSPLLVVRPIDFSLQRCSQSSDGITFRARCFMPICWFSFLTSHFIISPTP